MLDLDIPLFNSENTLKFLNVGGDMDVGSLLIRKIYANPIQKQYP